MAANELRLDDGHATYITLESAPTIKLYEKSITPPGMTAGGPIDTTTMRNTTWRTMAPRQLKTLQPVSATVAFATDAIPVLYDNIRINQPVYVTFPDGSSVSFWGWIEEFSFGEFVEGEQPTATLTIQPGNRNSDGDEIAPSYYGPDDASNPA